MLPAQKPAWLPLGALLVREELITPEQLELALGDQQATGLRLGELLVAWGWVESAAVSRALAEQYEMAFLDLDVEDIDPAAVARLSAKDARNRGAIPIRFLRDGRLLVGVANPTDVGACDELRQLLGASISLVVVDQLALNRALAREYA
jgi:MSHA biogenesis protein MshE